MHLKGKIRDWLGNFLDLYQTKDVTPYMHALYAHVTEFLNLYTNISHYTQQGMEKYNDRASKDYFRSTNHRGIAALKQLFLKKNRIQYLEAAGYARVKNTYKCSNCSNIDLGTQLRHVHLIVYIASILHVAHILLKLMGNGPQNVCRLQVTSKAF